MIHISNRNTNVNTQPNRTPNRKLLLSTRKGNTYACISIFTVNTTMTHSLLLSSAGLERVTDWVIRKNTHMRILHVLYEPTCDRYVVVLDCSARDATYLDLLEQ
jgi:hypothetical protein